MDYVIKKIAEIAGVSPATVSRVLNNPEYHCTDPKARERIWKAVKQLNYVPNEAARNLKKGDKKESRKTHYIQILMTRTDRGQTDLFFDGNCSAANLSKNKISFIRKCFS